MFRITGQTRFPGIHCTIDSVHVFLHIVKDMAPSRVSATFSLARIATNSSFKITSLFGKFVATNIP